MPLDGDRSILFSLVDMLRCVFLASLLLAIFASSGGRGGDSLARITPRGHMSRLDAVKSMYAFGGFVYDIDVSSKYITLMRTRTHLVAFSPVHQKRKRSKTSRP